MSGNGNANFSGNGTDQVPIEQREIKPRDPNDPLATTTYKGQFYSREEANEMIERESHTRAVEYNRRSWEESEAGRLCIAFYDAFRAYEKYLQEFPHAVFNHFGKRLDYKEHMAFEQSLKFMEQDRRERAEKDRRNMEKAQRAARCQHIYVNGDECGAPRVRGKKLCHMHERMEQAKAERLDLGPMEDPDSIQMVIQKLQLGRIDGWWNGKSTAFPLKGNSSWGCVPVFHRQSSEPTVLDKSFTHIEGHPTIIESFRRMTTGSLAFRVEEAVPKKLLPLGAIH